MIIFPLPILGGGGWGGGEGWYWWSGRVQTHFHVKPKSVELSRGCVQVGVELLS